MKLYSCNESTFYLQAYKLNFILKHHIYMKYPSTRLFFNIWYGNDIKFASSKTLFQQLCLRGFGDLSTLSLDPPAHIFDHVMAALDSKEANWQPEDGPKPKLAEVQLHLYV